MINDLREYFGLSQDFLASYFHVSRSAINMFEQKKRNLPVGALTKLVFIEALYYQQSPDRPLQLPTNAFSFDVAEQLTKNTRAFKKKATKCALSASILRERLHQMDYVYQRE